MQNDKVCVIMSGWELGHHSFRIHSVLEVVYLAGRKLRVDLADRTINELENNLIEDLAYDTQVQANNQFLCFP